MRPPITWRRVRVPYLQTGSKVTLELHYCRIRHTMVSSVTRTRALADGDHGMKLRWSVAVLFVFVTTGIAGAQVTSRSAGDALGATSQPLKNAPFSAVVITQYDRALDNGGRIHRETQGRVYRDSQGRMRTESEMPSAQPTAEKHEHITINDPVQHMVINLNPKSRTATIYHFGEDVGPNVPGSLNAKTQSSQSNERSSTPPHSTIQIGSKAPSPIAAGAINNAPPADRSRTGTSKHKVDPVQTSPSDTTTVSLGSRNIEGVTAIGTRTTRTLDADLMGREKPVVTASETWFSPELGTTVLTITDDGQSGHSTMKLVNIMRTEPEAHLFRIPADYAVRDSVPASASNRH